ncbi:MAG: hypothetical protein COS41_04170 [Elusimicrobia bacterium CG03_land_8_20_14_0_80_50_18]|nr:MAG: hypothetical protein COS41_04170 [Elusimicrobia bacterium CG03_land_8_20_14_0_80_50_18]PIX16476.1 MAG: hypothetical protein COZ72_00935 [Elusimicrobia bacterium CG_4_8_14_3_um_filter_50_9]
MNFIKSLSNPSYHQADVWLAEEGGKKFVRKDFRKWGLPGRFLLDREASFYKRLRGIKGIPEFYGSPESGVVDIEYIEGNSIKDHKDLPAEFFDKLTQLVSAIQCCGVLYFDLRHKSNLLVRDGEPVLIDFATCFYAPPLVPFLSWVDSEAVLFLKHSVSPGLLSAAELKHVKKMNRICKLWFFNRIVKGD